MKAVDPTDLLLRETDIVTVTIADEQIAQALAPPRIKQCGARKSPRLWVDNLHQASAGCPALGVCSLFSNAGTHLDVVDLGEVCEHAPEQYLEAGNVRSPKAAQRRCGDAFSRAFDHLTSSAAFGRHKDVSAALVFRVPNAMDEPALLESRKRNLRRPGIDAEQRAQRCLVESVTTPKDVQIIELRRGDTMLGQRQLQGLGIFVACATQQIGGRVGPQSARRDLGGFKWCAHRVDKFGPSVLYTAESTN
jgi:hypothetical protein